jgi:WD40 repeat protein
MAGGIPSRDGEVVVVDVETGAVAKKIDCGHRDTVNAIAFSPDGKLLASGSSDRQVRVFEVASGKLVQTLEGHTSYVQGVSWHRNGRVLASAGAEKTVKLWNLQTGEQIRTIDTFDRPVTSLAYLGYRAKLIVDTTAGLSEFIRDDGGAPVVLTESGPAVNVVAASEDGLYVVTGDQSGVLRVRDVTTGKPAATFEPTRQK